MICIFCNGPTQVINSRLQQRANSTWRRRKCSQCERVMTTTEAYASDSLLSVQSHTAASIDPLSRDRLLLSVHRALRHRSTAATDATGLTATILQRIIKKHHGGVITRGVIAQTCLQVLSRFDKDAAAQYKAFHRKSLKKL